MKESYVIEKGYDITYPLPYYVQSECAKCHRAWVGYDNALGLKGVISMWNKHHCDGNS